MISLDIRRRSSQRSDILCCILPNFDVEAPPPLNQTKTKRGKPHKSQTIINGVPSDKLHTITTTIIEKVNSIIIFYILI